MTTHSSPAAGATTQQLVCQGPAGKPTTSTARAYRDQIFRFDSLSCVLHRSRDAPPRRTCGPQSRARTRACPPPLRAAPAARAAAPRPPAPRNTIIGATVGTLAVIGGLIALVVVLVGGSTTRRPRPAPSRRPRRSTSRSAPPAAPTKCAADLAEPARQGRADRAAGVTASRRPSSWSRTSSPAPARRRRPADLTVNYVGVSCSTGKASTRPTCRQAAVRGSPLGRRPGHPGLGPRAWSA